MSKQKFYQESPDILRHTIPASQYVQRVLFSSRSPFKRKNFFLRLATKIASFFVFILQRITKSKLYVENSERELILYGTANTSLLRRLLKLKIVSRWECGTINVDAPKLSHCTVLSNTLQLPSGKSIDISDHIKGYGVSKSLEGALTIALAELIERWSTTRWDDEKLATYSIRELKDKRKKYFARSFFTPGEESDYFKEKISD